MIEQPIKRSLSAVVLLLVAGVIYTTPVRAVTLRDSVEVTSPPFTLQDVTAEEITGKLAGLDLGSLPDPGKKRLISRAYIMMQARRRKQVMPSFEGAVNQVEVTRPSRTIERGELTDAVESLLEDELAVTENVEIRIDRIPDQIEILPGPYSLKLEGWNPYREERGRTNYRINVRQQGSKIIQFKISASISHSNKVPVAQKPINRGQEISSDLIQWKKREISSLSGNIITSKKAILGMKASNRFKSGDIITGDQLKRPIIINRRDPIKIVLKKGGFTITAKGEALEDGAKGDRIMVKNRSSEVELLAEVIGERRVLIRDAKQND